MRSGAISRREWGLRFVREQSGATVFRLVIYRITRGLWRWEVRSGAALFRCGTGKTEAAAEAAAKRAVLRPDVL
jgi:hypothetical protein